MIVILLLGVLALLFDPRPAPTTASEMRAIRMSRFRPNEFSRARLRRTSHLMVLAAVANVRALLPF